MASLVASGSSGGGQTATVTSLSIAIPAGVAAGDRLVVIVNSSDSALTFGTLPSGTTVVDGPRANGTNQGTAVLTKTLAGTEGGTTYTVPWSTAARATLQWRIWRGTGTGAIVVGVTQDTTATANFVMPTVPGVAAGSVQEATTLRRRSGAAANFTTIPSPYTPFAGATSNDAATAYGSGVNVYGSGGYVLSSAAGTVGGETFVSGGVTSVGTNYVLILPPPAATNLNKLRLGANTVGLRVGTATPSKAYLGSTQVWP